MKKIMSLLLVALMILGGLTACGGKKAITSQDYSYVYSSDIQSMDYLTSFQAEDHRYNANFVDGLLENDSLGNYVPCLAESWEPNEDASVWTFHIRQGVQWVTSNSEPYAEVTAHDWVTALQHAADFKSKTLSLVQGIIVGLDDYVNGKVGFEEVGVKAIDDYTLEYTLVGPVTYFDTMTTYSILYPINKEFLESKGEGCKLGAPDTATCAFGAVDPTSILYNGGYILTNFTSKSVLEMQKNANYWDAEHVYINKVTFTYDDGSDTYSVLKGFEDGIYNQAAIKADWEDYAQYKEQYGEYMRPSMPDMTTFNIAFNYNRVKNVNTNKNAQQMADTHDAIMNKNFRLAVMFGFDKLAYAMQGAEEEVAKSMLRNTWTPGTMLSTKDGSYGSLIRSNIDETVFGKEFDLNDGQNAFYDPAKCLEYIEKAKAEGVKFPVTLDIACYEKSQRMINQHNSLKKSLAESSNGQIDVNIVMMNQDDYYACTYMVNTAADSDWDISTATGWGPDYMDPLTFLGTYLPASGDMMQSTGLEAEFSADCTPEMKAIMKEIGLYDYAKLVADADAIKNDNDARFAAFAKADAWLLNNAFTIPVQCTSTTMAISKIVPFTAPYSVAGISEYKFKFMQIQEDTVTAADYAKAKEAWLKARG